MDRAQRWRMTAKRLAESLETGDHAQQTRALVIYRQAGWRDDMAELTTTDSAERRWRAELRLDNWDENTADHAALQGVETSGEERLGETLVACTWVTSEVGIGAAMFELMERMRPVVAIELVDFDSVEVVPT